MNRKKVRSHLNICLRRARKSPPDGDGAVLCAPVARAPSAELVSSEIRAADWVRRHYFAISGRSTHDHQHDEYGSHAGVLKIAGDIADIFLPQTKGANPIEDWKD